jgi:predicted permease
MRRVFRLPIGRANIAREVDDELSFHLEMRAQRLVAGGMSPDAAREEAFRQFGNVDTVRQNCVIIDEERERAMSRGTVLSELQQDVIYALRAVRRNAGFTAVIVGSLALGIGANTAIFSLIDAVVVRTLPVRHANELVAIGDTKRVSSYSQGSPRTDLLSYPLYRDIRDQARSFTGVIASGRSEGLAVRIDSSSVEPEHPGGRFVTANYFAVLGVPAFAGRVFDGSEDQTAGGAPVAVISHAYWTRRFHNDPATIGRAITINGIRVIIIGVAPPAYTGEIVGAAPNIWLPVSMHDVLHPNLRVLDSRPSSWLLALGRLAPGVTIEQARQELIPLITRSIVANAAGNYGASFVASKPQWYISPGARGFSRVRATFQTPLLTLMIGVGLLLCIICANVANLLLARAIARGREMAVRLALGANRARLVRQLMTESILLALLGAASGLLLAWWGSRALIRLAFDGSTIPLDLGLDLRVLLFTLGVSCIAVALFGLMPALRASRVELATMMRASGSSVAGGVFGHQGRRVPLGKLVIAAEVALSVVLLVGAGMLVHSLRNVESVDIGLDRDHLVILDVDVNARGYAGARLANLAHTLSARIVAIPGVVAAAFSENGIFSGTDSGVDIQVPGFVARTPDDTNIAYDQVGPGYVTGVGARLLTGRDFLPSDENGPARQALVNQSLAAFYFPKENAVGKYLYVNDSIPVQIIGVIADTRDHVLEGAPSRRAYFSYVHSGTAVDQPGSLRLAIRTNGDPAAVVQQIRKTVIAVDPALPIDGIDPLATLMRQSIREERLVAKLGTGFGVLALLLASIGLYGVMTYAITRRTSELGLRVALGAQRQDLVRMVLHDALRLVALGMLIGLPLALVSARLLETELHGVGSVDPPSIAAAMAVLTLSAIVAVLLPALRASNVPPIVALRAE